MRTVQLLFLGALLCFAAALWAAPPAAADCPDVVTCDVAMMAGMEMEVGRFSQPTCYKFGAGCRPWHCDNAPTTDRRHWSRKCQRLFPKACDGECIAHFPGALLE